MPALPGNAPRSSESASSPPADAPIPTTRNEGRSVCSSEGAATSAAADDGISRGRRAVATAARECSALPFALFDPPRFPTRLALRELEDFFFLAFTLIP